MGETYAEKVSSLAARIDDMVGELEEMLDELCVLGERLESAEKETAKAAVPLPARVRVGDFVRIVAPDDETEHNGPPMGTVGQVVRINGLFLVFWFGWSGGHRGSGYDGPTESGWWVRRNQIEPTDQRSDFLCGDRVERVSNPSSRASAPQVGACGVVVEHDMDGSRPAVRVEFGNEAAHARWSCYPETLRNVTEPK